jgi:hypothetical protein
MHLKRLTGPVVKWFDRWPTVTHCGEVYVGRCTRRRQNPSLKRPAAKSVFQIHSVNEARKVEIKRTLRRSELLVFFEKWESCTVVTEACGAAHHWARVLTGLGHTVKLIAAETVRPFVKKGTKNDAADAAAICEAASRPDVKFVPPRAWHSRASWRSIRGAVAAGQTADDAGERHARPGS